VSREAYDAIKAVNFSALKFILRSPEHFLAAMEEDEERDETKYAVGNLAHAMILEGKDLRDLYAIKPAGMTFATKEGKAWRDAQTLPILKEEDSNRIPRMAEKIANHPEASQIIRACPLREHAITYELGGVKMKSLLDAVGNDDEGRKGFMDFKTTTDARQWSFAKRIMDFDYDLQLEIYGGGLAICEGAHERPWSVFVVQETHAPFSVQVFIPGPKMIQSGQDKLQRALEVYKKCAASDNWPGYPGGIQTIEPPEYALKKLAVEAAESSAI